ncbi:hypothetical protein F5X98DRAFT_387417 [Xylaria grammica]|nr:hypothetical protein F5X98DRAFT_387417 [Xylaria grammica]
MPFSWSEKLYPQYKEDTKLVAQWLDATSKAHGFVNPRRVKQQTRTKGQYKISIDDFEAMANFLSRTPHVSVPSYVRTSLARAIRCRSTHGDYLQKQRPDKTEQRNHLYFIDVLRNVQGVLDHVLEPANPATTETQTAPAANKFSNLDVSGLNIGEEDFEDHALESIPKKESPELPKEDVIFEPWKDDQEEAMFLWRLLIVDANRIRGQVCQIWELYKTGDLGLTGVSVAHNVAIHVVQKLEEDIHSVLENWGGFVKVSTANFKQRYVGASKSEEETASRLRSFPPDGGEFKQVIIDEFDIAEEEMVFAREILRDESWVWSAFFGRFGQVEGQSGGFILKNDRKDMTNFDKYQQDRAVVSRIMHDVLTLVKFMNRSCSHGRMDEFSEALGGIIAWTERDVTTGMVSPEKCPEYKDKITFQAVFALQLLLDSIHSLGTSLERPYGELREKTSRIFKSAKALRQFYQSPGSLGVAFARAGTTDVMNIAREVEKEGKFWLGSDPIDQFRKVSGLEGLVTPSTEKDGPWLKLDAPLCGWWLYVVKVPTLNCSLSIANHIHLIMACARLYIIFKRDDLIQKGSWPDMEAFVTLHRDELWKKGTEPTSRPYGKNWMRQGSNNLVGACLDGRNMIGPGGIVTRQCFKERQTVSSIYFKTFVTSEKQTLHEEDLEVLMRPAGLRWYNGKAVKPCPHHGWDGAGKHKGDKNPASSEKDNPFLRLAQTIDAEDLEMSFDYMSLYRVCWMVLRELIKSGRPILDALSAGSRAVNWDAVQGHNAAGAVNIIVFRLFQDDVHRFRDETEAIAEILVKMMNTFGRVVHTSTGIDWTEELKCSCDDLSSL